MIASTRTSLLFAPTKQYVEAIIGGLSAETIRDQMSVWWNEACLKPYHDPEPIDRHWDWNDVCIDYYGQILESEKIAIITGDGVVQGVMLISCEAVPSGLEVGEPTLFIELIFTAPRNRPELRCDGSPFFVGVGTQFLCWAAAFSKKLGCQGRIKLDGSPDFVEWYKKRGLKMTGENLILYEGINYTPMELPTVAADKLLTSWEGQEL